MTRRLLAMLSIFVGIPFTLWRLDAGDTWPIYLICATAIFGVVVIVATYLVEWHDRYGWW